jgi:hypothetical protein
MNRRIVFILCILLALQLALASPSVASAASLSLASFPLPEESATIYDENGNGAPDLAGDTWVFDRNNNQRADLVIRFRQSPTLTAEIYDDTDANQQVDYQVGASSLQILESHWRIQITARDGTWTLPDGAPDWNLDLQADSGFSIRVLPPIMTTAKCQMANDSVAIGLQDQTNSPMYGPGSLDGQPDFQIRYWDQNKDGIPDYEWRNFNWGGHNDVLLTNTNPDLRYVISHRFPPLETLIGFDWDVARLVSINTLIPARSDENGYFLLFNRSTAPEQINSAFENPFAFYDLHNDHNCNSELKLRAVTDISDRTRRNFIPYSEIRYSWAQDTSTIQYRLYLLGQVYADTVWKYPVYPVAHIGYDALPAFVLDHAWRGAIFAATEPGMKNPGFTEGIYENLFYTSSLRAIILSNRNQKLPSRYLPLYLNLREEYSLTEFKQKPTLYFSPVDRRVHLFGAREGVVIFSADTSDPAPGFDFSQKALASGELSIFAETVYADTDNDGYADTWTYYQNGQPVQQLVIRLGAALLATKDSIQVKKLPPEANVFSWQSRPPTNTAEWKSLQAQLTPAQAGRHPLNDLLAIFSDLPGDVAMLPNTALTSISVGAHELFAGIITLGASENSTPSFLPFASGRLDSGSYVLRARDGVFWVEKPSSHALELSPVILQAPSRQVDGLMGQLSFTVKNAGNADVPAHLKVLDALSRQTVLFNEDKIIPAVGQLDFSLPWAPVLPGAHQLIVQVDYEDQSSGQPLRLSQQLDWQVVLPDPTAGAIFLYQPYVVVTLALITLLIGFVAIGAWSALKDFSNDEPDNE